ncbi:MAG: DUF4397 domain-containing protein [Bacteroidota bacterium]
MKKFALLLFCLGIVSMSIAQTARVQIIHNSPTPTVDIYANSDLLLDDFAFRTATPFIDVPAGVEINIGVALRNSTSSADAIANFPVTFEENETYVVVARGIVGGNPGFGLSVFDMGAEQADSDENVGILFFHGSPDAPTVDVVTGGTPIIDDVSFGEFQGYLNVPADNVYQLDVTPGNDNSTIVASYEADLSFWAGRTAVIFATGFLGGGEPGFEPWVALSTGGTFPLNLVEPPAGPTARVQIIHNSPTPTVDIYANADRLLDNFAFRTATPFMDVPAGVEINIGVALATSTSAADAIANFPVTFEAGETYVVVASGIVGGNPGFGLSVFDMGEEQADSDENVGILFFHGSPDAPTVDVVTGGTPIIDDVSFGEFQGYLNIPANNVYELDVTPGNDNATVVASYAADLSFWAGRTAVIFASGFLGGNTPGFEPWVALSTGGTFPLPQLQNLTGGSSNQFSVNTNTSEVAAQVFPNPASQNLEINMTLEVETPVRVTVFNQLGASVIDRTLGNQYSGNFTTSLDVSNLQNGTYYLSIGTNNEVLTQPFVVLK